MEQHPFDETGAAGSEYAHPNAPKLCISDMIRQLEQRKLDAILVPCFISHTFIDELRTEVGLPRVDIMEALAFRVERRYLEARRGLDYPRLHRTALAAAATGGFLRCGEK